MDPGPVKECMYQLQARELDEASAVVLLCPGGDGILLDADGERPELRRVSSKGWAWPPSAESNDVVYSQLGGFAVAGAVARKTVLEALSGPYRRVVVGRHECGDDSRARRGCGLSKTTQGATTGVSSTERTRPAG